MFFFCGTKLYLGWIAWCSGRIYRLVPQNHDLRGLDGSSLSSHSFHRQFGTLMPILVVEYSAAYFLFSFAPQGYITIRIGIQHHHLSSSLIEKKNVCFRPGLNRRPSACKADVITTTLRKRFTSGMSHTSWCANPDPVVFLIRKTEKKFVQQTVKHLPHDAHYWFFFSNNAFFV